MKQKNIHGVNNRQDGFTLVELLTVISIVAFLSTIIMVGFVAARKKGRDARRMEDIKQMDTAIQLYIADKGHAPYLAAWNCSADGNQAPGAVCYAVDSWPESWELLAQDLSPYMKKLPTDPCGASCAGAQPLFRFQYEYESPYLALNAWCLQSGPCTETSSNLNTMYIVSAQHLESTLAVWSFQRLTFAVQSFY